MKSAFILLVSTVLIAVGVPSAAPPSRELRAFSVSKPAGSEVETAELRAAVGAAGYSCGMGCNLSGLGCVYMVAFCLSGLQYHPKLECRYSLWCTGTRCTPGYDTPCKSDILCNPCGVNCCQVIGYQPFVYTAECL